MELNELDKYRFPKTLRQQSLYLGLPLDELTPVSVVVGGCMLMGHYLIGLGGGLAVFFVIRKIKKGRGSCWLRDLMYRYLPTSLLRGVFHKIPDSCFRQWTK